MITIEQLKKDIELFLSANNRPCEPQDVDNYIYQGAYEKLMKDKYGNSPFERPQKSKSSVVDKVPDSTVKVPQNEGKEPQKVSLLSGGIKIKTNSL